MVLNAYARTLTDRLVAPVARGLARVGVTANGLTLAGLAGTGAALGVVLAGAPRAGGALLLIASAVDALDGAVARIRGTAGALGAFVDSVADRVGDAAIFATLGWLVREDPLSFTVAMVAFGGAQLTSYIRAKAESLGWSATVGVLERAERVILVGAGLLLDLVVVVLWLLALGALITVGQRLWTVRTQARLR